VFKYKLSSAEEIESLEQHESEITCCLLGCLYRSDITPILCGIRCLVKKKDI